MSNPQAEQDQADDEDELTPEEEEDLLRGAAEAEEDRREGRLIPWEALFPRKRLTG